MHPFVSVKFLPCKHVDLLIVSFGKIVKFVKTDFNACIIGKNHTCVLIGDIL